MKVTIQKIRDTKPSLDALAQVKLPALVSMKLAAVIRNLQGPLLDFDKAFNSLLMECGAPVPDTSPPQFTIKDECVERFNKEAAELHAHEIELPGEPIPAQMLGNAEVSPAILATLDWLVVL